MNYDDNRAERDFNMNPPTNAPGQGDDGWGDLFSNSSTSVNQDPMGSANNASMGMNGLGGDINSILNGQQGMPGMPGMSGAQGYYQQEPQKTLGEKASDFASIAVEKSVKGVIAYFKMLIKSLTNNTESEWHILGERICVVGLVLGGLGLIFLLGSIFFTKLVFGASLALGSVFAEGVGIILVLRNRKDTSFVEEPIVNEDMQSSSSLLNDDDDFFNESEEDYEESSYDDDEDFGDWDSFGDTNDYSSVDDSFFASNEDFDVQEAVNNLDEIPAGQYTRQYLFETFEKILPSVKPSFMDMEDVLDGSDEFMMFEDFMRRSADQTGIKEDKLDELQLLEVRKNLFIIQLIATRPTGLKEKDIADGIADCYKRDDYGTIIEGREGVFARVNSQVGRLIIDIFLCNNVMVSLGDIYRKKSDFLLDAKNTMPLIWGVNELGQVYCYDGMKDGNGGIIISGEARSGKSWKGQSLIAQMCMFRSPKELELYFYDVKGSASDYAYLSKALPHCKGFCGDSLKFNDSIGNLLEKERTRRTALLGGKYTNVKDYNKDHPYEQIPTIYIVIDEMATAMSEMKDRDIEIRKKFDSLLIQIATKYPYLEIKLMLFPHRIVNDIINKTVSSMISTRSVMGNVPDDELKTALDIKKGFPYSLVKTGDMAIKTKSLNNGNAVYSHSEVLSTDEQTNRKIFDYIGAVWNKLEPDCKGIKDFKQENKVVPDNTISSEDYTYKNGKDFIPASNVDESFWEDELSNTEEDDFWNSWK